jgi:hypothetical protein
MLSEAAMAFYHFKLLFFSTTDAVGGAAHQTGQTAYMLGVARCNANDTPTDEKILTTLFK